MSFRELGARRSAMCKEMSCLGAGFLAGWDGCPSIRHRYEPAPGGTKCWKSCQKPFKVGSLRVFVAKRAPEPLSVHNNESPAAHLIDENFFSKKNTFPDFRKIRIHLRNYTVGRDGPKGGCIVKLRGAEYWIFRKGFWRPAVAEFEFGCRS